MSVIWGWSRVLVLIGDDLVLTGVKSGVERLVEKVDTFSFSS